MRIFPLIAFGLYMMFYYFHNTQRVPITGRKHLVDTSLQQDAALGLQSYQQILSESKVVTSGQDADMVKRVGERLKKVVEDPGFQWEFNSRTQRFVLSIQDEPNRPCHPRFAIPPFRRLYRWHPEEGHYSLAHDDDDTEAYADNLYEYDAERLVFKRVIIVYEHDPQTNQFVRVVRSIK